MIYGNLAATTLLTAIIIFFSRKGFYYNSIKLFNSRSRFKIEFLIFFLFLYFSISMISNVFSS